ncbi:MAG: peptidylprolyl isomerase [Campylobacterota bacterium]|nr:peptidylprolyl isomerase [Campylobacterota bacterium]
MIKKITLSLVASLVLGTTALSAATYGSVDGEQITDQDIATLIRNPQVKFDTLPANQKKQVIEQLVEKKLLTKKALKSGIESKKSFKEAMAKLKKEIALEIWMQEEFKKIKVSDADIKKFYNANTAKFKQPQTFRARHILLKSDADAKAIIKALNSASDKKAKFIELAKTKSTGPSGPNGGDLNWFDEKRMVPEFSAAVKKLSKGNYTKSPVKTQFGYHVIYLEDQKAATTVTLDKATPKIKQALMQEKFRANIKKVSDQMRKTSKVIVK